MQLRTIPRAYVRASIQLTKAPLRMVEQLTGNEDNDRWPPELAFDAAAARIEQVLGSLLGDPELTHQGEREEARVAAVRDAIRLETVAEQKRSDADETFRERRAKDERQRSAARERARGREQQAERDKAKAKREVAAEARAERERVRAEERSRAEALEEQERSARAQEIAKERSAIAASKRAVDVKGEVLETDKALRATKARRSAS